jgi:hypothetical protein
MSAAPAIHINGRAVHPPLVAVVANNHVLVPARAVFQALGATVTVDGRTGRISVHRGLHFANLEIGSRRAFVDNHPVALDVAPHVSANGILVPLSFAAAAFGGTMHALAHGNVVDIEDAQARGGAPDRTARGIFRPARSLGAPATIEYKHPEPGEYVTGGYPSISGLFRTHGTPINMPTVRLFLDGQDVGTQLFLAPGAVGYTPGLALQPGIHQVAIRGTDAAGRTIGTSWTFGVVAAPGGSPPGVVGYQQPAIAVSQNAIAAPGGSITFSLTAPQGGSGFVTLCGYAHQYPLAPLGDRGQYVAVATPPVGYFAPACQGAIFFTSPNGAGTYLPLATPLQIDTRPRPSAAQSNAPQ